MRGSTTREALLGTAQRLFHERGFAATGMADILAASGAGSGSAYHFFRGKEQLLAAVLDHLHGRLEREILGPARAAPGSPADRVFAVLAFYRGFLEATGCTLGCPVGNLAGEVADTHPAIRERLAGLFAAWRDGIAALLAPERDRLPQGRTPGDVATFVLAVMEGAVMQARVHKDLAPFDTATALLRDWFDLLLPADPARQP